ncbi:uncharacterized protein [Miscanthus floridulus]|uniref:uncharacterized protein n=1 Tax=Miscanthus floridulus TaxID=154761 RepID=UPI00345950F9
MAVPKYHKLTFVTYDDKEDPLGWLNKCEQFFHYQMTWEVDKCFGPALSTNHLTDLAWLPFGGSIDVYMMEFQACVTHAGDLSTLQKAQLFIGGLLEHIRVDVELLKP